MVRVKFKVNSILFQNGWDSQEGKSVPKIVKAIQMYPVTGQEGENKCSGGINITIVPEDASSYFEMNKEYYVDFTKDSRMDEANSVPPRQDGEIK